MTFGENLKRIRKEKGWTQEQLAKEVGVTQSAITQWEHLISAPKKITVKKIADALMVDAGELDEDYNQSCGKWISIYNEMPPNGLIILLLCGMEYRIGFFDRHINRFISKDYNCTHIEMVNFHLEQTPDNWAEIRDDVTHWMPIPPLPEDIAKKFSEETS